MDCWWVVDEWRTERTYWEVNSSALTCEELHYTSITSLTHSFFPTGAASQYRAATISLLPTGLEFWFNHNPAQKYITPSALAYSKSCKHFGCNIDCNLIPFQSIPFPSVITSKTLLQRVENLSKGWCIGLVLNKQTAAPSLLNIADWIPLHNTFVRWRGD